MIKRNQCWSGLANEPTQHQNSRTLHRSLMLQSGISSENSKHYNMVFTHKSWTLQYWPKLIFWFCDEVCVAILTRQIVGGSIWTVHCPSLASSRTISGELWHLGGDLSALSPNRPAGGLPTTPALSSAHLTLIQTWYHVSTTSPNTCDVQIETETVW